jgi:hypothetical protein
MSERRANHSKGEEYGPMKKTLVTISASAAGATLVVAALRFSFLNWVVDVPGWLVSRIVSVNFHEGEGAFGFFLAIILSWFLSTTVILLLLLFALRALTWSRNRVRLHSGAPLTLTEQSQHQRRTASKELPL